MMGGSHVLREMSGDLFSLAKSLEGEKRVGVYLLGQTFWDLYQRTDDRPVTGAESAEIFRMYDPAIVELFAALAKGERDFIWQALVGLTGILAQDA